MPLFPGFSAVDKIHESQHSMVFNAHDDEHQRPVVLKLLKSAYPTPSELRRYRREFEITRSLGGPQIVEALRLVPLRNSMFMVLEDFGGISLAQWLEQKNPSRRQVLDVVIQIARALGFIHDHNVIHKDINPSNVVINPKTGLLKVIDFGIATRLPRQTVGLANPDRLEGTPLYMSPEQTGRMNRFIDYRSDFYSLGVTLYQMLTRRLPFQSHDKMELVHSHLAKTAAAPHTIDPEIAPELSAVVMKMLAKTAESRYRGASGLIHDLELCRAGMDDPSAMGDFILGKHDFTPRLDIPQKLYGREDELNRLLAAFERTALGGSELVMVSGYSGIGKTSLVQEIHKPITRNKGIYIAGKFDQLNRIPYGAIVSAFRDLIRQLLTESEDTLKHRREQLLEALGPNGQVMIDVVPEIALLIGEQPPVAELGPIETNNRFRTVFMNFLGVFCNHETPLVLFLDDLQWADNLSLSLIELMMTDENTQHLLLIGAYRDNEVDKSHPLMHTLEAMTQELVTIEEIQLSNLALADVSTLLCETLSQGQASVDSLAQLTVQKTGGNPFFVNQFLESLYSEGHLNFKALLGYAGQWEWDTDEIARLEFSDNVVDLMVGKLRKMPETGQRVVRLAACIGNRFDLETLALIDGGRPSQTLADLEPLTRAGFILPVSDFGGLQDEEERLDPTKHEYRFLHDRVQQAAYELFPEGERQEVHLRIGRRLLAGLGEEERDERVFELVEQLNKGRLLIKDAAEQRTLVRLSLAASRKAKQSTAYREGLRYLSPAMAGVDETLWDEDYQLASDLWRLRIDLEALTGNYENAEGYARTAIEHAATTLERAEIYNQLIIQYTVVGRYEDAIKLGRAALKWLGVDLPEDNLGEALMDQREAITKALNGRAIISLVDLPECQDPEKKLALVLLSNLTAPTFLAAPDLMPLVTTQSILLSLEYGDGPGSVLGYSLFGLVQGAFFDAFQEGGQYGELGMRVAEKYHDLNQICQAYEVFLAHVGHWVRPIHEVQSLVKDGFKAGVEAGNQQWAGYIIYYDISNSFVMGMNLEDLKAKSVDYISYLRKTQNSNPLRLANSYELVINNLSGQTAGPNVYSSAEFVDENAFLEVCRQENTLMAEVTFDIHKGQTCYLFGDYQAARAKFIEAEGKLAWTPGTTPVGEYFFYHALTLCALIPSLDAAEQAEAAEKLEQLYQRLALFKDNCEETFLHKYLLVGAEMARLDGRNDDAMDLYDQAMDAAAATGFHQNEALANERAGLFWQARGKRRIADTYLRDALYKYRSWGARRKAAMMEREHTQLTTALTTMTLTSSTTTTSSGHQALDLVSVLKAARTISGEIMLTSLLQKMMAIVIENAGAERGFLLREHSDGWFVEAAVYNADERVQLDKTPLDDAPLARSVVQLVIHTGDSVVLDDAVADKRFAKDDYIAAKQTRSLLCQPILNHGQVTALLYLENNLTTGAFTSDRLEVLAMLASQASVSIENAGLYSELENYSKTLEQRVEARTIELKERNEELRQKGEQILSSIRYAQRIQKAILPGRHMLGGVKLDAFSLFRPRDIVSGDFYWFKEQDDLMAAAVVDCTGHGVPGAFMTLIGHNLLTKVVAEKGLHNPAAILEQLHLEIRGALRQEDGAGGGAGDGMDISMVQIGPNQLTYVGAHRPLYHVHGGKLSVIRGDRGSVGGRQRETRRTFTNHTIPRTPGDMIYLSSDGFADQVNTSGKKYGIPKLKSLLTRIANQDVAAQRQALTQELDEFTAGRRQRDDITIVGIRI